MSREIITLRSVPYIKPPIHDHLKRYYASIGKGVEFEYLDGSSYVLGECAECGLIFQKEIPNPELMARLYERWLDPEILRELERNERGTRYALEIASEIANVIDFLARPPSKVAFLDFGMGWGAWCLMAKGFGCDAYGTDLSDARSNNARQSGINVLRRDQLAHHRFDFINAEQVFEHLADPHGTLIELAAILKPGGVLRIGVPPGWDIKRRLRVWDWNAPDGSPNSLNAVAPLQHINCFSFRSLVIAGRKAGLREFEPNRSMARIETPAGALKLALKLVLRPAYRRLFPGISEVRRQKVGTIYFQ